ncbi:MAG: epoxyqueuosine reductase [Desulfobacterales bacterium]|nr:epoxyqueuosine reductase [Desulfobacterales bacterium]
MSDHDLWLKGWMEKKNINVWGVADLSDMVTPTDELGDGFPRSVSFALPMTPTVMAGLVNGPTEAYAEEYIRLNKEIIEISTELEHEIHCRGARAFVLHPSRRTDPENIKGDFPQKTSATRAGLGWVGKNCQLITRQYGPWLRLGTVFTALDLTCADPITRSFCGDCRNCLDACPSKALKGGSWEAGMPREELLDARCCDQWKKTHYKKFSNGHNCGICSAVCPFGQKTLGK